MEKLSAGHIIEIDGVEFLIDVQAAEAIERKDDIIALTRLFDNEKVVVARSAIEKSAEEHGIIDKLT